MPHFVSLIVNNKGEYTAAITSRITRTFKGTVEEVGSTFNNVSTNISSFPKEYSDTCVRYNYFDIVVERDSWYNDISDKISSITTSKKTSTTKKSPAGSSVIQPSLFNSTSFYDFDSYMGDDDDLPDYIPYRRLDDDSETEIFTSNDMCCDIIKETLYLGSGLYDNKTSSIVDASRYYNQQKRKSPKTTATKLEKTFKSVLRKGCGNKSLTSAEAVELCDDLAVYISWFEDSVKVTDSSDVSVALDDIFDIILNIIER